MLLVLVAKRILQLIPILIGVTLLAFIVLNLLPGNVALAILGDEATPSAIHNINQQLGLDRPVLVRYWEWVVNALHGRLGFSLLDHQSVSSIITQRAPVTLELGAFSIVLALVFAVPTAIAAARRPGGVIDRLSTLLSMAGASTPNFVLALLLVLLLAVRVHLFLPTGFVPLSSGLGPNLKSILLPAISLAAFPYALYVRLLRGELIKQMRSASYIETARAKGSSEGRIIIRHAFPNAIFGLITVVALNIGTVIGGAVLVEEIFAIPGMGQTLVAAINDRDSPVVQGIICCLAIAVVGANLFADLLYIVLDPRIRRDS
jgi:peptide/nickel transport system permease protein